MYSPENIQKELTTNTMFQAQATSPMPRLNGTPTKSDNSEALEKL